MEEDTHLCLRCQQVVVGLDNYVSHRGRSCLPSAPPVVQSCWANAEDGSGEGQGSLEASDFFLSLELKSAKPNMDPPIARGRDSESSDDDMRPPRSHTGGKWKPGSRQRTESHSEDDLCHSEDFPKKFRQEHSEDELYPPRSHTSGKWQPGTRPELTNELWVVRGKSPIADDHSLEVTSMQSDLVSGDHSMDLIEESIGTLITIVKKNSQNCLDKENKKCFICDITFDHEVQLGIHMFSEDHVSQFRNEDAWMRNVVVFQNQFIRFLPFQCAMCRFYFADSESFVQHLSSGFHLDKSSGSKPLICLPCGHEISDLITHFSSESCNTHHFRSGHPVVVVSKRCSRIQCHFCRGKCRLSPRAFFNTNHEIIFTNAPRPSNHKILRGRYKKGSKKPINIRKNFKCQHCPFQTLTTSRLSQHFVVHQGQNRPRPFHCQTCDRAFFNQADLNRHSLRHSGVTLVCSDCDRTFFTRTELRDHSTRVHSSIRSHLCQICGYSSKSGQQLHRHQRRVHDQGKRQCCPHPGCKFLATFSADMVRHLRIHSGIKPYACPHCRYRCSNQENLRKHVLRTKKHRGKNLYPCLECRFTTNNHTLFVAHLQENHPEKSSSKIVRDTLKN